MQILMGVAVLFSLLCSVSALHFSVVAFIDKEATKKSTHKIEYRDPFKTYPDELELEKDEAGNVKLADDTEDMYSESTVDEMNKFITENGVIL